MRVIFLFLLSTQLLFSQEISFHEHVELGDVHWLRNYDEALAKAKQEKKPLFILFQEVPGCSTCRNYGANVLSHPLIVEGIENEFIPLCIFNNAKGEDAKILEKYNEQSWNNPVVRIVNSKEKDIVKRVSGNYSLLGLITAMNTALTESSVLIPAYLSLLEKELQSNTDELYLSMYCFWTGEKEIADIDGVIGTEAGFMNGREVVKVSFDKNIADPKDIHRKAKSKSCGDELYLKENKYRKDKASKYYLRHSWLKHVPLTAIQETTVNRALALKEDPLQYLSPKQVKQFELVKMKKGKGYDVVIEKDFIRESKRIQKY